MTYIATIFTLAAALTFYLSCTHQCLLERKPLGMAWRWFSLPLIVISLGALSQVWNLLHAVFMQSVLLMALWTLVPLMIVFYQRLLTSAESQK